MALPALNATFASSADLPRKQMLAKWLVEELGETQAPSNVLVSGLSDTQYNGLYVYDGEVNGRASYRFGSFTIDSGGVGFGWSIRGVLDIASSDSDVSYPWLALNWYNEGIDPTGLVVTESPAPSPLSNYYSLPERYLWAKIAVAAGGDRSEEEYITLPKRYIWSDIYRALTSEPDTFIDWSENVALGHIAAAYRGDTANPANLATYIDWPWRYKVAAIIDGASVPPVIPFSPLDISGLQLWLDGSDASTMYDAISGGSLVAANGAIARWEDKSGNGKHATQSVSNNRPLRKTNQQNSLDAVEFDGTNDFVEGSQVLSSQPCSVVAVCKFTDSNEVGCYFGQRTGFIPFFYRWGTGSGKLRIYSGADLDGSFAIALDQWKVLRNFADGSNSKIFINNTLDTTGNSGSSTPAGNYVIANFNDGQFQGLVYGELLVYNKILTEEESSQIETYLNDKWSVY